jgi:EAL domain-containing protein (putative c-di-GMP-specific phosphodiesterase class I)
VGIAVANDDNLHEEEILRRAHTAMERAKSKGKNNFVMFDDGMSDNMLSVLKIENQLRKALEKDELVLQYQPQIETESGKIIGAEALVRWQSAELGFISPGRFIPIAEDTGLIVPMGAWILEQACWTAMEWREKHGVDVRMGVNLSSKQFSDGSILETVKEVLEKTKLPPALLDLELTESLLMKNIEQTIEQLKALHELGVTISVDDFGTGYSSLAYLKRFPIDTLKIDQSFVRDITSDPDDASICRAIISMAHSLRLNVIAEGVETGEHYRYLRDLKCDELQGYHFSKPLVSDDFTKLLVEKKNWCP